MSDQAFKREREKKVERDLVNIFKLSPVPLLEGDHMLTPVLSA